MDTRCTRRNFVRNAALGGIGLTILKESRPARGAPAEAGPGRNYYVSTLPFRRFPLEETLRKIRAGGFDTVEIAQEHLKQVGDPAQVKRLAEQCGVRVRGVLAGFTPADDAGMSGLRRLMDDLPAMGVSLINVASGGPEESDEPRVAKIIQNMKALVGEAEKRGVYVAFFTHTNNMAYNLERTERIFEEIPAKNFGLYYSPYHFHAAGEDPIKALERLRSRLYCVYFNCGADPRTGEEPFWGPKIDYRAVCQALVRLGYTGDIMLLYLGLKVDRPDPIVEKLASVRNKIEEFFRS